MLEPDRPVHELGTTIVSVLNEQCAELLRDSDCSGELNWDAFSSPWWRAVRRIVLGPKAATTTSPAKSASQRLIRRSPPLSMTNVTRFEASHL